MERVASLPEELLDEVEQSLGEIVQFHKGAVYHPTPEELDAIDEGLAQLDRGEIATDKEVEEAFAKFRRA
jgi:hypothetical protein